jgi:hypothetical protein
MFNMFINLFKVSAPLQPPTPCVLSCLSNTSPIVSNHILYDVREPPANVRLWTNPPLLLPAELRNSPVVSPPTTFIRLISKSFPWYTEITNAAGVTCQDVLLHLHQMLQHHVTEAEWWIVNPDVRVQVAAASLRNCRYGPFGQTSGRSQQEGVKRVDWLMGNTLVAGLERDVDFIDQKVQDAALRSSTWVVVMSCRFDGTA